MKPQYLALIKLLETELLGTILSAASTDMSRQIAAISGRLLNRWQVEENLVPQLCSQAAASYSKLLPALHSQIGVQLYQALQQELQTVGAQSWPQLEALLQRTVDTLTEKNTAVSRVLIGQLIAIDSQLRDNKDKAYIESSAVKPATETADGQGGELSKEQEARLLNFLKQSFPGETDLQIAGIKPIPGGFSKYTSFITLENNLVLPSNIVMRRDAPFETTGSSVTMEFPVLQKMYAAGVAVAQPFALESTGNVLGMPFMLVARIAGRVIGDFLVVSEPNREVALDLARKMALLHNVPADGLEDILDGGKITVRQRVLTEIQKHEKVWQMVVNNRSYTMQAALDWLQRNISLADGRRTIVHRDIGAHNMLVHDNKVAAFLDWETVVIGTPSEDAAYASYMVRQMMDWDEFLAAYEAYAQIKLDRRQVDFYMIWGSVRIAIGMARLADDVIRGELSDIQLYYIGDYFVQKLMQRITAKLAEVMSWDIERNSH